MNTTLIARLEAEIVCACDPTGLVLADHHAWRCYRQQLIDTPTWTSLHALAVKQAQAAEHRDHQARP